MPAPTFSNLTSGAGSAATSFNTASVSPAANRLILISVTAYLSTGSAQPAQPTVTGNGITYALVRAQDVDTATVDRATMWVFRGMAASPSAGAITISFGAVSQTRCVWSVDQSDANVDTTGTNGSGAIVQSDGITSAGATSLTVNYPATMTAGNSGFSAWANQNQEAKTPRAGWTELSDVISVATASLQTQYRAGTDAAGSSSWTTSVRAGGIIVEVKPPAVPADSNVPLAPSGPPITGSGPAAVPTQPNFADPFAFGSNISSPDFSYYNFYGDIYGVEATLQLAAFEADWTSTADPKTVTVTDCQTGDYLFVIAGSGQLGGALTTACTTSTTAGSTGAWTEPQESLNATTSVPWISSAVTRVTGNGDVTVQVDPTKSSSPTWGFAVVRARGSAGLGTSGFVDTSATQAVSLTVQDSSAVFFASFDFDAGTVGTDWTPTTNVTLIERTAVGGVNYTVHAAYWENQTAGTRNYGSTGAGGATRKTIGLEILGPGGALTQSATVPFGQSSTLAVTPLVTHPATVALAQTSTLAVTPLVTHPATVAMASSSTLAVTPLVTHPATVAFASSSTLAITADVISAGQSAAVAFDQSSTLAVTPLVTHPATVALAQTSSLAVTPLVTHTVAVALDQSSTLAVTPLVIHPATVALAQSSTLAVTPLVTELATVALAQSSTLAVTPLVTHPYAVILAQSSTLAVTGFEVIPSTVAFASTSTLGVAVQGAQSAAVALTQSSVLTVAALVTHPAAVAFGQTSTLGVTVAVTRIDVVAFAGSNTLQVTGTLLVAAVVAFASTSTVTVAAVISALYEGTVSGSRLAGGSIAGGKFDGNGRVAGGVLIDGTGLRPHSGLHPSSELNPITPTAGARVTGGRR